jgi:hypothetical protein
MAAEHHLPGALRGYFDYRPVDDATNRRITEFALILAALFLLDILTTQVIIWLGGIELNPVMTGVVASPVIHIALKSAILLLIILVSVIAEKEVHGSSVIFYCVLITLYIFVVVNNVFAILPQLLLYVVS